MRNRTYVTATALLWALMALLAVYWVREPARMQSASRDFAEAMKAREPQLVVVATDAGLKFHFEPAALEVKPGQLVAIKFINVGPLSPHDFSIGSLQANTGLLDPGQERILSFRAPDEPGEYEFICTVPGHAQLGMTGKIVVKG